MKSLKPILFAILITIPIALVVIMPLLGVGAGYLMDYYPGVIDRMGECEKVEELLGGNPRLSKVGFSYGFAKIEGAYGRVTWRFPVKGDKASGSFKFYLEKHAGSWEMLGGLVSANGKQVEVVRCEYYEEPDVPQIR